MDVYLGLFLSYLDWLPREDLLKQRLGRQPGLLGQRDNLLYIPLRYSAVTEMHPNSGKDTQSVALRFRRKTAGNHLETDSVISSLWFRSTMPSPCWTTGYAYLVFSLIT